MSSVHVSITNLQASVPCDVAQLREAALCVFADAGLEAGEVSVAIVDDATIHQLNRRHLKHDYPTDVLSFPFNDASSDPRQGVEGEIVVSAETARREAAEFGWSCQEELTLYVVHGALHLVGYLDKSSSQRQAMRAAERRVLRRLGMEIPTETEVPTEMAAGADASARYDCGSLQGRSSPEDQP